ncbi:MAG TPA: PIN domain-containing protein [Mucilaginibacter sp.]
MNGKVFLDTNILVYAHTDFDTVKQLVAQQIITDNNSFVSTQVLQELTNTLNRKFKVTWNSVEAVLRDVTVNNSLHVNTSGTIFSALNVANRYNYSFYDCMIISAALESNCSVLYSEDLQDGHIINKILTIKNPFK